MHLDQGDASGPTDSFGADVPVASSRAFKVVGTRRLMLKATLPAACRPGLRSGDGTEDDARPLRFFVPAERDLFEAASERLISDGDEHSCGCGTCRRHEIGEM